MSRSPETGVGASVKAIRFQRTSDLEISPNTDTTVLMLQELLSTGKLYHAGYTDERTIAMGRATAVARNRVSPFWGPHEGWHETLPPSTKTVTGMEIDGEELFNDSQDGTLSQSLVHGSILFQGARHTRIRDSVLTGGVVLGTGPGSNDPEFSSLQLAVITDIAEGLHGSNRAAVQSGLVDLDRLMSHYDTEFHGTLYEGDEIYESFGDGSSAAKAFDTYYLPWLQVKDTSDINVDSSIIHGFSGVFSSVLGGEIVNSAVTGSNVFSHTHMDVRNTLVLTGNGSIYLDHATFGDPRRARTALEAVAELPEFPLVAFAT